MMWKIIEMYIWSYYWHYDFLGAQAKQGASNSLILLEDKDEDQGKTSAFFAVESYAFGNSLNLLDIFWNLLIF